MRAYAISALLISACTSPPGSADVPTDASGLDVWTRDVEAEDAGDPADAAAPEDSGPPGLTIVDVDCSAGCGYTVVAEYPHDMGAFTQGLAVIAGILYEGTGLHGASTLRRVDLETGQILQSVDLDNAYFGEGIAIWEDRIIQLTWRSGVGFVYERDTFQLAGQVEYETEGWGLTYDGTRLVMSDGTPTLYFCNPDTFALLGSVEVTDDAGPVTRLNELEFVRGEVFANVWQTDEIVRIRPRDGRVIGRIDLSGIRGNEPRNPPEDVLNGIAYDAAADRLFVTGKLWPRLFEIRLTAR